MATVTRKCPLIKQICGYRHGHMVNLPGNTWSLRDWAKRPKKRWIPTKGTIGYKLDSIMIPSDLQHKNVDPILKLYAYQVDPYPKTECCDPVHFLCNLTRTAEPISYASLNRGKDMISEALISDFVNHVEGCCFSFNNILHQKQFELGSKRTPIQLDQLAKHYSSGFLQNVLHFLFSRSELCGPLLVDSYISSNHQTAAFWRHSVLSYEKSCHNFQFHNFIDLMVRSSKLLSYRELSAVGPRENNSDHEWAMLEDNLHDICTKRLVLFKETQQVEQYPGFIKETIFPYNHTLFKVVSSDLSDRALQAAVLMTGFGQTLATTQHRLGFPCRVDLLPAVEESEAVNVVVTDGNRYCLGVYQCNTTNTCQTQLPETRDVNMCALSPVQTLVSQGLLNTHLLADLLSLLTANPENAGQEETNLTAEIS